MVADVKVIKEKLSSIAEKQMQHIRDHIRWDTQIACILVTIVIQIVTFAYCWGSLNNQVQINTARWEHLIQTGIEVK
jgi:hypothetical protein